MLDRKTLRKEPELIARAIAAKNENADLEKWLAADSRKRELMLQVEELRSLRNRLSREVSLKRKKGSSADLEMEKSRETGKTLSLLENELSALDSELSAMEMCFPNIPDQDVPLGGEANNRLIETGGGNLPEFDFQPLPHWELMKDVFVPEDAGKITGSNFILLRGWAARLQRTLINWMLDYHTQRGMEEVWPPFLANRDSMTATAQLPKMQDDMYEIQRDGLFLIPTGEVPITNIYRNCLLEESDLPVKLCGYTPCFRREAGSYGKETRGLNRVHQFEKVEMVRLEHPQRSDQAHRDMVEHVTAMLDLLSIPWRILLLATGDLSFAAARCYDIEIWSAGQQKWLEVSSVSNFRDFQARRGSVRFKPSDGGKPEFVHTLNGSGLALPRLIISLVENNQMEDGSIALPPVIAELMGTEVLR